MAENQIKSNKVVMTISTRNCELRQGQEHVTPRNVTFLKCGSNRFHHRLHINPHETATFALVSPTLGYRSQDISADLPSTMALHSNTRGIATTPAPNAPHHGEWPKHVIFHDTKLHKSLKLNCFSCAFIKLLRPCATHKIPSTERLYNP